MAEVLVGALIAGFFALGGALYQHSRDHQRWLRTERLGACVDLLDGVNSHYMRLLLPLLEAKGSNLGGVDPATVGAVATTGMFDSVDRILRAQSRVDLVCSHSVQVAAARLKSAVIGLTGPGGEDEYNASEQAFRDAARADLHADARGVGQPSFGRLNSARRRSA